MRLPRLAEGQTRFNAYHAGIREAARIAHTRWLTTIRPQFAECPLRLLRTNVTQLFIQEARTLIGGLDGVRFIDTKSLRTLVVLEPRNASEPPWVARFKHVDSEYHTSNIPTFASRLFDAQEDFPEIPSGSIHFTLGYHMRGPDADLVGPHVVLAVNDDIYWHYNIDDPESGTETAYLFGPNDSAGPRRVRPIPGVESKRNDDIGR